MNKPQRFHPADRMAALPPYFFHKLNEKIARLITAGVDVGSVSSKTAVMADGKIAKCSFYRDQAVATLDQGLATAWQKVRPVSLKTLSCNCAYIEVCRGGCRYRAELIDGKGGKDLYRCTLYGIL